MRCLTVRMHREVRLGRNNTDDHRTSRERARVNTDGGDMRGTGVRSGLAVLGVLVITLAGCSGASSPVPSPAPTTHTLTGQLIVADLVVAIPICDPTRTVVDALSDLQDGTQLPCPRAMPAPYLGAAPGALVTVTSTTGKPLGTGHLRAGVLGMHGVRYPFTVDNLAPSDSYVVKVSTVTSATFSRAALETDEWVVELTVGDKAF